MLFLAEKLLNAAGFQYDESKDTGWPPLDCLPWSQSSAIRTAPALWNRCWKSTCLEARGSGYRNFALRGGLSLLPWA